MYLFIYLFIYTYSQVAEPLGNWASNPKVAGSIQAVKITLCPWARHFTILALGECPCTYCKSLSIRVSAKWLNGNVIIHQEVQMYTKQGELCMGNKLHDLFTWIWRPKVKGWMVLLKSCWSVFSLFRMISLACARQIMGKILWIEKAQSTCSQFFVVTCGHSKHRLLVHV